MVIISSFSHYIFGIGNPFASDDRIGLVVIEKLEQEQLLTNCFVKTIATDVFEVIEYLNKIPENRPILIIDAVLTDQLSTGTLVVFNIQQKPISELKLATLSHTLSVIDLIIMNKLISKRNLLITFLGIVIKNTEYGEDINIKLLERIEFILSLIKNFTHNTEIYGIYPEN